MRILGIDPSLRGTGYGIVELKGTQMSYVESGTLTLPPKCEHALALHHLHTKILQILQRTQPDLAAMEKVIFVQSIRTAITLGSARGAVLAALGSSGLTVVEYPAKTIKQAVTGVGSAHKEQMIFMIRALLGLDRNPTHDEADALAVAITHTRRSELG